MTVQTAVNPREGKSTREVVLEAATHLIHLQGYQKTSIDDVLGESGVGKGSFYHYFKSKEDLGYAILDDIVTSFVERTLDPCFADTDGRPIAQIRCFLDHVVETQRARACVGGCPLGNLASELSDVHEGCRERLASVFSVWRGRLTLALRAAQRRGDVGNDCPVETAR